MPTFWMPTQPRSLTLLSVLPTLHLMFNEIYITQAMFNLVLSDKKKHSITPLDAIFRYATTMLQ